jgi:pimeloyl-ACP methyl ester carboxylesterase
MDGLHHTVNGVGPPMLLIHGTGADSSVWRAVVPTLARSHRVIAYDRRGHGRSAGGETIGPGAHAAHADDARQLLRVVGGRDPALVVGWSAGAIIALHIAARHPDRVRGLVLAEPPLWARRHGDARMMWSMLRVLWHGEKRPHQAMAAFYRAVCRYQDNGRNGFDALSDEQRQRLMTNAGAGFGELRAGTGEDLTPDLLSRIQCPVTLLLGGRSAPMFARAARDLERCVPQLRVATVSGAGHLMMLEAPAAFAAWVHAAAVPRQAEPSTPTSQSQTPA